MSAGIPFRLHTSPAAFTDKVGQPVGRSRESQGTLFRETLLRISTWNCKSEGDKNRVLKCKGDPSGKCRQDGLWLTSELPRAVFCSDTSSGWWRVRLCLFHAPENNPFILTQAQIFICFLITVTNRGWLLVFSVTKHSCHRCHNMNQTFSRFSSLFDYSTCSYLRVTIPHATAGSAAFFFFFLS